MEMNMNKNTITEDQMINMAKNAVIKQTETVNNAVVPVEGNMNAPTRKILLIGTGDGGCNIASAIHAAIPETVFAAYNTSSKAMKNRKPNVTITPKGEDGSGKARDYSKEVFKNNVFKRVLETIQNLLDTIGDVDYILITSTCDGGTGGGISPMLAELLIDNIRIPVLLMGVYPSLSDDAKAQYNALEWQDEVLRNHIPYIILDNQDDSNKPRLVVQKKVNDQAVEIAKILVGTPFGETKISSIDNRDMAMLLHNRGERIVVYSTDKRPTLGKSLDEFLLSLAAQWNEPIPVDAQGYGLFVKGPMDFIQNVDTTLANIRTVYGEAVLQYTHIEDSGESSDIKVALIAAGCSEPADRMMQMRQRYDDIIAATKRAESRSSALRDGMNDPAAYKKETSANAEPNYTALDI